MQESSRLSEDEHLRHVESLARAVVDAALEEESFEVYLDEGPKTPLHQAITKLAQSLRQAHHQGDGCIPDEEAKGP